MSHTLTQMSGVLFRKYHSEDFCLLGVNLPAIDNFVTAVNDHDIGFVFVLFCHYNVSYVLNEY